MLLLPLLLTIAASQVDPAWQRNQNIDAGQSKPINFDVFPAGARNPSSVFTYTQSYNKTNFTVVPRVFLGQLSFDFFSNSTNNNSLMGYNITTGTPSLLTFNYQVTTYGVTIVGLHFIYLAVSPIYDQIYLMQNYYLDFAANDAVRNVSEGTTRSQNVVCSHPENTTTGADFSNGEIVLQTFILGYTFIPSGYIDINTSATLLSSSQFTLSITTASSFSLRSLAITAVLVNTTQLIEYNYLSVIDLTFVSIVGASPIVPLSTTMSDFNTQYFYRNTLSGNTGTKIRVSAFTYLYYNATSDSSSVSSGWSLGLRDRVCPVGHDYYFFQNRTCVSHCPDYYYTNSSATACVPCHYSCQNCTSARNQSRCSRCDSTYFRVLTGTSCPCQDGYFDNNTLLCIICNSSCLTCFNELSNGCLSCNATLNRILVSAECICDVGYIQSSSGGCVFNPICGDGVLTINQQCDDGNANDGDGCSSSCLIEPDHSCNTNASLTPPSTCYYSSPIILTPSYVFKTPLENSVKVELSISAANINTTNLKNYIQSDGVLSVQNAQNRRVLVAAGVDSVQSTYSSGSGRATIKLSYSSDIDLTKMTILFTGSSSTVSYFTSTPSSSTPLHSPNNKLMTTYLSPSQLRALTILSYFYLAVIALFWLLLIIAVVFHQAALVVQAFLVLQTVFECLLQSDYIFEGWTGLVLFGKYTYGYNIGTIVAGSSGTLTTLSLSSTLLNTLNLTTLLILLVTVIITLIFLLQTYSIRKQRQEKSELGDKGSTAKMASERIAQENDEEKYLVKKGIVIVCLELGISFSLLTVKISVMSLAVCIKEGGSTVASVVPFVLLVICSAVLWLCYYLNYDKPFMKELSYRRMLNTPEPLSSLQPQPTQNCTLPSFSRFFLKSHYLFLYLSFLLFALLNSLTSISTVMHYLLIVGSVSWFVAIFINDHYLRKIHTARAGLNVLCFVVMNGVVMAQTVNVSTQTQNNAPAIAGIVVLGLCLIGNAGVFVRIERKRRRQKKRKNKVQQEPNIVIAPKYDTEQPINLDLLPPDLSRSIHDQINPDISQQGFVKDKSEASEGGPSIHQLITIRKQRGEEEREQEETKERRYQLQLSGERLDRTKPLGFNQLSKRLDFEQIQSPQPKGPQLNPDEQPTEQQRFQTI